MSKMALDQAAESAMRGAPPQRAPYRGRRSSCSACCRPRPPLVARAVTCLHQHIDILKERAQRWSDACAVRRCLTRSMQSAGRLRRRLPSAARLLRYAALTPPSALACHPRCCRPGAVARWLSQTPGRTELRVRGPPARGRQRVQLGQCGSSTSARLMLAAQCLPASSPPPAPTCVGLHVLALPQLAHILAHRLIQVVDWVHVHACSAQPGWLGGVR